MAKIHFIVPNKINALQSLENKQKISREKAFHKKNETIMKITVSMCAESLQSCLTLCNPIGCSQSGSSVHGFSRQDYQSGLPCPPPRDLPDSGIEPESFLSPTLAGRFFNTSATWEAHFLYQCQITFPCSIPFMVKYKLYYIN